MSFWIIFIAVLGGFQFGYNTGVISGALLFVGRDLTLTIGEEGQLVSIILVGALIGALSAGPLADNWGRRLTIIISAGFFLIGTLLSSLSTEFEILLVGRFLTGLGVGITAVTVPLYLAEMAPTHKRGAVVSINQLMTTIGILCAYLVNYFFAASGNWRYMFGLGAVFAVVQGIGMLFLPETQRWLSVERKKKTQASRGWELLLAPGLKGYLLIGILLNCFQQITGINTIIYYAPKIFEFSGFTSDSSALLSTVGIGVINVVGSFLAILLLDRAGRRPLLLWGTLGMIVCLSTLAFAFYTQSPAIDKIAFFGLLAYVGFFAIGLGAVTSVLVSEIYPSYIRGRAIALTGLSNWLFNYLVSSTFLELIRYLTPSGTFGLYAIFAVLAFWFIYRYIPETKGKSLEQIEAALARKKN